MLIIFVLNKRKPKNEKWENFFSVASMAAAAVHLLCFVFLVFFLRAKAEMVRRLVLARLLDPVPGRRGVWIPFVVCVFSVFPSFFFLILAIVSVLESIFSETTENGWPQNAAISR